jgi:hypothetical protein
MNYRVQRYRESPAVTFNKGVAAAFGERDGRTVSRVIAGPISEVTGLDEDAATQVGHLLMLATPFMSPTARKWVVGGLVATFAVGVARGRPHRRHRRRS